jgi:hypothetical protein
LFKNPQIYETTTIELFEKPLETIEDDHKIMLENFRFFGWLSLNKPRRWNCSLVAIKYIVLS